MKPIKIKNPLILYAFGWKTFPTYVTAAPGLWFNWFLKKWFNWKPINNMSFFLNRKYDFKA